MKGGKLTCNRSSADNEGCIKLKCVDYEKGMYNSFTREECNKNGWVEYFDEEAKARYWYNWDTEEATWLNPNKGGKRKSRKHKLRKHKLRKHKSRKHRM
jgi:hypothetical protein